MTWKFDQAPNIACITCRSVVEGNSVLVATHYEDDHSWAFLDGQTFDPADALIVAMSEVLDLHPDLDEIANLPPGWSATRVGIGEPWSKRQEDWAQESK
jgi:hypothetical protein